MVHDDSVGRDSSEEQGYNEGRRLLEDCIPSLIEILCDALLHILENALCLLDFALQHALQHVIRLIKLEL